MADLRKDTLLFFKEYMRMCDSSCDYDNCKRCGLHDIVCSPTQCSTESEWNEIIERTQKWHDEHPQKTYAMDFLEKFPDAVTYEDRHPIFCRKKIYGDFDCADKECVKCWNEVMPDKAHK